MSLRKTNTPFFFIIAVLFLSSCTSSRSSLSEPLQPLPTTKGDIRVSTSFGGFSDANLAGNIQAAYTMKDRISVGLNYYGVGRKLSDERGDDYQKSFMGEGFVGMNWFKPLKIYQEGEEEQVDSPYNGIQFDVSVGFGVNNIHSRLLEGANDFNPVPTDNAGVLKYHTRYAFLQTGLVVRSKWVDVGMSLRGVGLKYISGEVNNQNFSDRQILFRDQAEEDGVFAFLETGFRFAVGGPKVKVFTSISVVSNVFGDKTMVHLPRPLLLGLEFNLGEFSKKE
ncbi:MAG: hypothetical protein AB8F74_11970 [Saprospiraceae bacterium]